MLNSFSIHSCLILLTCVIVLTSSLILSLCHNHMFRGEYHIAEPTNCVKHSDISTVNYSADVFNPQGNYIKISIVMCEMYETVSETTHYFFGAKCLWRNYTVSGNRIFLRCNFGATSFVAGHFSAGLFHCRTISTFVAASFVTGHFGAGLFHYRTISVPGASRFSTKFFFIFHIYNIIVVLFKTSF